MTLGVQTSVAFSNWIKSEHPIASRVLVVLDDLDGIEPQEHRAISRLFATDTVDLIYTSRNPSMADAGSQWQANVFKVPVLSLEEAAGLLTSAFNRGFSSREDGLNLGHSTDGVDNAVTEIVKRVNNIPAAIVAAAVFAERYGPDLEVKLQELLER